jgi:hypothetical protein
MGIYASPRFAKAVEQAQEAWAAADPESCAALAGCGMAQGRVIVPFFGRTHWVDHPSGLVTASAFGDDRLDAGTPAHESIAILLLHYLLGADGTTPSGRWLAFRDLPGGMFYAQAFAGKAEAALARWTSGEGASQERVESLSSEAVGLGGQALGMADVSFRFEALPRLPVAVLLWRADREFPGEARVLFDATAHHCLPTEDLAGVGDWLVHRLARE